MSRRPVAMAAAGAVSHDRDRRRKSGGCEARREEEGKTQLKGGGGEEGKWEVKECRRVASQA